MEIYFNVDTQKDFLDPEGALAVPGVTRLRRNLAKLTNYATVNFIPIFSSLDWHTPYDPEMKEFPPHCMKKSDGAKWIPEVQTKEGYCLFNEYPWPAAVQIKQLFKAHRNFHFTKDNIDVWTNPNLTKVVRTLKVTHATVYGVTTEYCVKAAVRGFLKMKVEVDLVTDAIKAVDRKTGEKALQEMLEHGALPYTTEQILKRNLCSLQ